MTVNSAVRAVELLGGGGVMALAADEVVLDAEGDGDREDAIREGLQTAGGQQAVVIACALSGLGGADERTRRSPPY